MTEAITRILVPVDFSAHSDRALHYAATLAGRVGASVQLLHVVEDPFKTGGAFAGEIYVPSFPAMIETFINEAGRRLESLKIAMFPRDSQVETKVVVGRAAHAIVDEAATGIDLIVMGTHGRAGFSHLFLGSVAERVVRTAPCAVLTVRGAAAPTSPGSTSSD